MPRLLTDSEIESGLKTLKGWKRDGSFIRKAFEFESFMDGVAFINKVALVAEKAEHHPDINVRYTTIILSVQTHSEGGVTAWDIGLARSIEWALAGASGKKRQRHKPTRKTNINH